MIILYKNNRTSNTKRVTHNMLHIHHTFIGLFLNVILLFKHFDMLSKVSHVIENSFICDLAIARLKIKKTVGKS